MSAIVAWPVRASRPAAVLWTIACLLFCLVALLQSVRPSLELRKIKARPPAVSGAA